MTELAIPEASAPAIRSPQPTLPVPAMDDIDSWTRIVVQVVRLAEEICNTPFVPDGLRGSAPAVSAAILSGREMGLGPMTSLANIDVIKGKPTQKPLLMRAMVQARGHKWVDVDVSDVRAVVKGCRRGETEWTEVTFTAAQAKTGGIDLGKFPADKLYARASSRLAKRKFADVIMGMAYSSDEAEDDDSPDVDVTTGEVTAGHAAIEPPKARTARRAAQRAASPAPAATPSASAATPPQQGAGEALPPLPGEDAALDTPDERNYDSFGTVTTKQLGAIWTILKDVYHFGADEKDQARGVCAQILGVELTTSTALSKNQAGTVIDTLAHWQEQAKTQDEEPRGYLMLMLQSAREAASGE